MYIYRNDIWELKKISNWQFFYTLLEIWYLFNWHRKLQKVTSLIRPLYALKNFNITSLQLLLLLLLIRLKSDVYLEMALLLHCTIEIVMGRALNIQAWTVILSILWSQNHFHCTEIHLYIFYSVKYVQVMGI